MKQTLEALRDDLREREVVGKALVKLNMLFFARNLAAIVVVLVCE